MSYLIKEAFDLDCYFTDNTKEKLFVVKRQPGCRAYDCHPQYLFDTAELVFWYQFKGVAGLEEAFRLVGLIEGDRLNGAKELKG